MIPTIPNLSPDLENELDELAELPHMPHLTYSMDPMPSMRNNSEHSGEQVLADAIFAEEPESVISPPLTSSPLSFSNNRPIPASPPLGSPSPSRSRFLLGEAITWQNSTIFRAQASNTRSPTKKSTMKNPLPPSLAHEDSKGGPPKPTLQRGISMSVASAIGVGIRNPEDPESLVAVWPIYAREAISADRRMIASWNRTLDVRLLFSGIFSAILTPFIVESYKLLLDLNPRPNFFGTDGYRVRVNAMWFGSLVVSLIAALLSIHCKQWLDGYFVNMHFGTTPDNESALHRACRLRQYRFEGLQRFYIHQVIGLLPVLLYFSLLFFAIGLIDFLWHLNQGIAIYISALCGIVVVFHVYTTILPFFTTRSPYRTPLSDFLGNLWRGMLQGKIAVRGLVDEEERRDVDEIGEALDKQCFDWLKKNTECEEYFVLAMKAEKELNRQAAIHNAKELL